MVSSTDGGLMFPIMDVHNHVIGFGGRVMGDGEPKYLNSPETRIFDKSRNLYGLNIARSTRKSQLLLCEGYMDVVSLHGAGFENAVATLGTAITPEQANIIKDYTKKVIISYDSDEAGQKAAEKAFRLLGNAGVDTKILKMNGAKDPDEYIKKFGPDKFRLLLDGSRSQFEFRLEGVLAKYDITLVDEKVKAASEIGEFISGVYSAVEREVYISRAAKALDIQQDSLKRDVERILELGTCS